MRVVTAMSASLLVALAVTACRSPGGSGSSTRPTSGRITVGAEKLDIDDCYSGQMLQFRGVDLFAGSNLARRVRLVDDPVSGFQVVLFGLVANKPRAAIDPVRCEVFDATLVGGNSYLNDVRNIDGAVKLGCAKTDAGSVTGELVFTDCSFDNRAE